MVRLRNENQVSFVYCVASRPRLTFRFSCGLTIPTSATWLGQPLIIHNTDVGFVKRLLSFYDALVTHPVASTGVLRFSKRARRFTGQVSCFSRIRETVVMTWITASFALLETLR